MEKQTKKMVIVGTNTLLAIAKKLVDEGVITPAQYRVMEMRNATLVPEEWKHDTIILKGDTNE